MNIKNNMYIRNIPLNIRIDYAEVQMRPLAIIG